MDDSNQLKNQYPDHMLRVQLGGDDFSRLTRTRRFDIRAPPTDQHLSTAECLAWVAAVVEGSSSDSKINENDATADDIYETIMKPLDLMVEKWRSFSARKKSARQPGGHTTLCAEIPENKN